VKTRTRAFFCSATRAPLGHLLWCCSLALSILFVSTDATLAQSSSGSKIVFGGDTPAEKQAQQALVKEAVKPKLVPAAPEGLDFQAPQIEFKNETHEIVGKGGVLISEGGVQVQADQGTFNTETKQGEVSGNVLMTSSAGVLSAESATVRVEGETGEFSNLEFDVEEEGYHITSDKARKISEFEFELEDSAMTTCRCQDGAKPWEIQSSTCSITQNGYAHSYGSKVYFEGVPIFYSPYLVFPVKNERASGLLPAQIGVNSRDGFQYIQPIFLNVDETTGLTVTPFIAARSRVGSEVTFERIFSETHTVNGGVLYSNESLRGDSLRGLNLDGVYDPTIDTNRFGGFYKQRWTSPKESPSPIEFIADGHYTSDNLFLREIPEPNIGTRQDQFLVSTALVRGTAFEALNLEARTEYNQALLQNQDLQFQRVPEFAASTTRTFRPFGMNPLGLKVVTGGDAIATDFVRNEGYDGWRLDLHPKVAVPFHIENYVRSQAAVELHQTNYSLRDTTLPAGATPLPDGSTQLEDQTSRTVPIFSYGMSTGVERVYGLERGNLFSKLVGLGARNEGSELTKLKHTLEPMVSYTYVPNVDQSTNPLFDQLDRFRERSLVTYGVTSRLYGRFNEPYERTREIEDLTRTGDTIPMFDMSQALIDFGRGVVLAPERQVDTREGEIRELGNVYVRQGYDYIEADKDLDPSRDGFTDVNAGFVLSPSYYVSAGFDSNIRLGKPDDSELEYDTFSSNSVSLGFRDDRDDALRFRYTFVDKNQGSSAGQGVNQLEGNFELKLHEQLRAGAYARYDAEGNEFIESQGLIRFMNSCKCWSLDLGVGERINPDRKQVLLSFTFGGLGSIRQGYGISQ
jgi:LPS-assembly protein